MKIIQGSLVRLGEGVKKDEGNGYQMRERESLGCRRLEVLSGGVFFWEVYIMIFVFFSCSISSGTEMEAWMLLTCRHGRAILA